MHASTTAGSASRRSSRRHSPCSAATAAAVDATCGGHPARKALPMTRRQASRRLRRWARHWAGAVTVGGGAASSMVRTQAWISAARRGHWVSTTWRGCAPCQAASAAPLPVGTASQRRRPSCAGSAESCTSTRAPEASTAACDVIRLTTCWPCRRTRRRHWWAVVESKGASLPLRMALGSAPHTANVSSSGRGGQAMYAAPLSCCGACSTPSTAVAVLPPVMARSTRPTRRTLPCPHALSRCCIRLRASGALAVVGPAAGTVARMLSRTQPGSGVASMLATSACHIACVSSGAHVAAA